MKLDEGGYNSLPCDERDGKRGREGESDGLPNQKVQNGKVS